jgi:hypothetical protein
VPVCLLLLSFVTDNLSCTPHPVSSLSACFLRLPISPLDQERGVHRDDAARRLHPARSKAPRRRRAVVLRPAL